MSKLINERQAADYLGIAVQTARNWRHLGKGPKYAKLEGSAIRYFIDDLDVYRQQHTITPRMESPTAKKHDNESSTKNFLERL
jgi:hypothetical protein